MLRQTIALLIACCLLPAACGDDSRPAVTDPLESRQIPIEYRESLPIVVEANTAFAFDLFHELRHEDGNLFLCPFSISTALAMTWGGARGVTGEEMALVLHFPPDQEMLHPIYGAVLASLEAGNMLGGYRLNIANRLWGLTGYEWEEPFIALTRDHYRAPMTDLDFVHHPEPSRLEINRWIEDRTEGTIPELLPANSITPLTVLVLTNAIYFNGSWAVQFDPEDTASGPFTLSDGGVVEADFMQQVGSFPCARIDGLSILALPYVGGDLSMCLMLPDAGRRLQELEESISPETLNTWLGMLETADVEVTIPRFSFSSKFELSDPLITLGMPSAFGLGMTDFTGITRSDPLFISGVYHEAFVNVDEVGTEAAGATGVVIDRTSVPGSFRADRPFLFLIRDHVTGSLLFLGRVADPTGG